jgi:cytoskeletal protein CcmA (bactofilin family)
MPADNRISTLPEVSLLYSDVDILDFSLAPSGQDDSDVLFLITKSGVKNEKITFKNLKSSILSNALSAVGDQIISGEKTFADVCTFQDTVFLNEVIDTTYSGDISGYSFIGQTGKFQKLGVGESFADKSRAPQYDLHVEGNVLIEGELHTTGKIDFQGDIGLNNLLVSGDFNVDGSGTFYSGLNIIGDSNISGDLALDGNASIDGDLNISGDLYIEDKIIHVNDPDTYIDFSNDSLELSATGSSISISQDSIDFYTSGTKKAFIDEQGRFGVNTDTPLGELTVDGSSYVSELYVTGQNGGWEKVVAKGYDEAVNFTTNLISGSNTYEIDFPKTFGEPPIVYASLNSEVGEEIFFFNIANISSSSYEISFNDIIPNNNYSVHTSARSTGDFSLHNTTTQSFRTQIIEGQTNYTINFPDSFNYKPVISATLERKASFSPSATGIAGDSFVEGWEYYFATDTDTWRRITTAEIIRSSGNTGDTDFDNDFYYVCIDDTVWGKIPLVASTKSDPATLGDIDYNNDYIFIYTLEGWKEFPVASWPSEATAEIIPYMISNISETSFQINFGSTLASQYYVHAIVSR